MSTQISDDTHDLIPADVRAAIELFATQLAKVSFPDVDASSLRREADELRSEAARVAQARVALAAAEAAYAQRVATVQAMAARAVAYARIFSQAHPERAALATALAALDVAPVASSEPKPPSGKRRGRPPKRSAELFDHNPVHEQPAH